VKVRGTASGSCRVSLEMRAPRAPKDPTLGCGGGFPAGPGGLPFLARWRKLSRPVGWGLFGPETRKPLMFSLDGCGPGAAFWSRATLPSAARCCSPRPSQLMNRKAAVGLYASDPAGLTSCAYTGR
jgi:hypothetical protein